MVSIICRTMREEEEEREGGGGGGGVNNKKKFKFQTAIGTFNQIKQRRNIRAKEEEKKIKEEVN